MKLTSLKINWQNKLIFSLIGLLSCLILAAVIFQTVIQAQSNCWQTSKKLPDISGLAWLKEGGLFLAVQDVKNQPDKSRVTLIKTPTESQEIAWCPLSVNWQGEVAQDLESIATIPGTNFVILGEGGSPSHRLFLSRYEPGKLRIIATIKRREPVENIEGIAVAKLGDRLFFLDAERAAGKGKTEIRFATLSLEPFALGSPQTVSFSSPEPQGKNVRQVSAMEVDSAGNIYIASAEDPNIDTGPFRSVVWKIGKIQLDSQQQPELLLKNPPERLAILDGLKVEGLAIREIEDNNREIFIGTDDENYGGILRLLPRKLW